MQHQTEQKRNDKIAILWYFKAIMKHKTEQENQHQYYTKGIAIKMTTKMNGKSSINRCLSKTSERPNGQ